MEYRIGDFAVITRISIKALRNYHEMNLLIPARVDPESGYRYYDEEQIERVRIISTLKNWNFSLKEIQEILDRYHEDGDLVAVVQNKHREIKEQISRLTDIEDDLSMLLRFEEERKTMETKSEILIKTVEKTKIIYIKYSGKFEECGKYIGKLYRAAGRQADGIAFNMYPEDFDMDKPEITVCLPVKTRLDKPGIEYRELQKTRILSTIHKGPYDNLGDSYKKLIDHKAEFGLKQTGPFREIYLKGPGMLFSGNPKKYQTELQMEIE